jgi:YrbI family 3-deoxy-D-manno-octulosonate 8-phosphate phosphatase
MIFKSKILKNTRPKIIFTDFDGCLTDDRVWLNQDGEEFIAANRKDGMASQKLAAIGINVVISSSEKNLVVSARGKKMGVEVLQGLSDKAVELEIYLKSKRLNWSDVWYIGNDVNDLGAIHKAALSICPSDAVKQVKKVIDYKLKTKGGYGIIAEIAEILGAY